MCRVRSGSMNLRAQSFPSPCWGLWHPLGVVQIHPHRSDSYRVDLQRAWIKMRGVMS